MISTVDHSRTPLLDAVYQQGLAKHHRYYMPGHKGGKASPGKFLQAIGHLATRLDLPELPNLDQLFAPEGVIQEAQNLAADAMGAEQSFFLVNGSSCGLMAALMSVCATNEMVIVPRNCHQSIVHGLILSGARPIWIQPPIDHNSGLATCITPEQLQQALIQYPETKAVIAVSPTYEGICGEVGKLAAIAHQHDIPLIVDEAHGAHFTFHNHLPQTAIEQGADVVVQSWHKVLGAMSQASVLNMQGDRINPRKIKQALTILQSSSPNYLLLASLDATRSQMMNQGKEMIDHSLAIAAQLREKLSTLSSIKVLNPHLHQEIDPLRLTLLLHQSPLSGYELDERLSEEFGIIAELPKNQSLTFVLGQGNSKNETDTLFAALKTIDQQYPKLKSMSKIEELSQTHAAAILSRISPREAFYSDSKQTLRDSAIGHISKNVVCPYPPGIPLLFPGEVITEKAIQELEKLEKQGCQIIGSEGNLLETLALPR